MKKTTTATKFLAAITITFSVLSAQATLTPEYDRGGTNIYHISPNGVKEVCVIPQKYPGAKYKKKDLKKEIELCNASFYEVPADPNESSDADSDSQKKYATALCAKTNSTNPAVNIFKIGIDEKTNIPQSKASLEANKCEGGKKLAKYKNSTSCSNTSAIIGYYHLSRILGNIGGVPVSVLRTMDIETHKALAKQGLENTKTGELINQTWSTLDGILTKGLTHERKDLVLTDDGKQSYGGMIVNPKNEEFYKEFFTNGADRAAAFAKLNPLFAKLRNGAPLTEIVQNDWSKDNLQKVLAMQDISEFILMDYIMDQKDRFGNIASQDQYLYYAKDEMGGSEYNLVMNSDLDDYNQAKAAGLVDPSKEPLKVKSMLLKDNDCGVTKENIIKAAGLLEMVRHMNPKTYKKLLQFQQSIRANKDFFTKNLVFPVKEYDETVRNVDSAAKILQDNCRRGYLRLDLNIEDYFQGKAQEAVSCELN